MGKADDLRYPSEPHTRGLELRSDRAYRDDDGDCQEFDDWSGNDVVGIGGRGGGWGHPIPAVSASTREHGTNAGAAQRGNDLDGTRYSWKTLKTRAGRKKLPSRRLREAAHARTCSASAACWWRWAGFSPASSWTEAASRTFARF